MIISIASGKGGTGKTLVATSLARSLMDTYSVTLLDCDVEEPNVHLFINPEITSTEEVTIKVPQVRQDRCNHCGKCSEACAFNAIAVLGDTVLTFPELCHGCGACSYLCPRQAISETPYRIGTLEKGSVAGIDFVKGQLDIGRAMATPVVRRVKQCRSDEGITLIDASPGTSCPVIEAVNGSDFCLLVTEPTPFGLNDLSLAVEAVKQLGIPCGVVINRAGRFNEAVEQYCRKENIPVLLKIPLDLKIACLYSEGITLADGLPEWKMEFKQLAERIMELIGERNCNTQR
ncbi:MAG: ATP-binding protein [Dehalococcoidaceae bacterium]|nr:ATP-binding protein [Dehalococcoidaceae bacterium]